MKKRRLIVGLFIIVVLGSITNASAEGPRPGQDCENCVYGETSYLAYEDCYLLEVGFPILFKWVPANRKCCRQGVPGDPGATGCYEWHEKVCQENLSPN